MEILLLPWWSKQAELNQAALSLQRTWPAHPASLRRGCTRRARRSGGQLKSNQIPAKCFCFAATLRVKLLALESEPDVRTPRAPTGTRRDVSAGSLGAVQGADCVYSHIGLASWGYVEPKYPN